MNPYQSPPEPEPIAAEYSSATGAIPFSGPISLQQVADAMKIAGRTTWRGKLSQLLVAIVPFALIAFILLRQRGPVQADFWFYIYLAVGGCSLVWFCWRQWAGHLSTAKALQAAGTNLESLGEVATDHITMAGPAITQIFRWVAFVGYRHEAETIILYTQFPTHFIYLVRSHFNSDADWNSALAIVDSQLLQK